MKRLIRPLTILIPISAILTLPSCAQQGEIKEPFEIKRHLDSSDYKGEIRPFKEPVVLKRLPYEQRSITTTRINDKADIPAVSTMTVMRASQHVTYPEDTAAAMTLWILGGESKSSTEPSTKWQLHLKFSFTLDLSDFSVSDKDYPVLGSTKEEQRQIEIVFDWLLDAVRELRGLENAYFDQPISAESNEFVFEYALTIPNFGTLPNFEGKLTAVGMMTWDVVHW